MVMLSGDEVGGGNGNGSGLKWERRGVSGRRANMRN